MPLLYDGILLHTHIPLISHADGTIGKSVFPDIGVCIYKCIYMDKYMVDVLVLVFKRCEEV